MSRLRTGTNPRYFHKSQIKFYIILTPIAAFSLLPLLFIIFHAFKPLNELFVYPPKFFPSKLSLDNFVELFSYATGSAVPVSRYLINSILTALLAVVLTRWVVLYAAFALSKRKFKGKDLIFTINNLALMFVPTAVVIPRYVIIEKLGLLDTFFINFLPLIGAPVVVFLLKQFMDQVPNEIIEAAQIDGAGDFYIVNKIVAPMVSPALATVAILTFQMAWNSTEASTYYINNENLRTFSFFVSSLTSASGNTIIGQGMAAAGSLLIFIPNIVLFVFMQSRVMNTMAHSGLK